MVDARVAGVDGGGIALVLMGFGVANLIGTVLAGLWMERSLRWTLVAMPLLLGGAALGLAAVPYPVFAAGFVVLWG